MKGLAALNRAAVPVAVSAVAVIAVGLAGSTPWLAVAAGIVAVVMAHFLQSAPRVEAVEAADDDGGRNAGEPLSWQRLAAAVPDPIVVFDRAGVVVHANPAAAVTFVGLGSGVDLQLRFRSPEIQDLLRQVLAGTVQPAIEYQERLPIERMFRVSASAVGEGTGLFVLVFRDQSEARRIDRMRADFIANASHELRTPLASISGFVETLRGPAREDARARDRFLQIMHDQTLRMARLIDDLLSLSRLEMKPLASADERVDVVMLAGSVADALARLAFDAGVTVEREFPAGPVQVRGGRDELIQVFENLLENAIKYGQSGKRVVVTVEPAQDGKEVEIRFRDFGPGMAEEHIPRVTERFYRVDVESSRSQKGTGLGLSIVKHILTRHSGRLSIRSKLGEGSVFTVHLPLV